MIGILALSGIAQTEEVSKMKGEFTLASGPYEVEITATYAGTIRRIIFDGEALGRATGYYGPIFAADPGKFIGAGHTEGGLEKLESMALQVDGKEVAPEVGKRYKGKSIVYHKRSLLDRLRAETEMEVSPNGIALHRSYEATEDQRAHSLYLYQFCWSADTREWIAETADGKMEEGEFVDDKGWRLSADVKWTALYDPAAKKGMLLYYPKVIPGNMRKSAYWDIPKTYHKYYLMMDIPKLIPKGTKSGPHTLLLRGIAADPSKWKGAAKQIVKQLWKNDPNEEK